VRSASNLAKQDRRHGCILLSSEEQPIMANPVIESQKKRDGEFQVAMA
jgi:hypothetical protein